MARPLDLVLFGATGFTGRQAAARLSRRAPPGLRWAIAGRDRARLQALGLQVPTLQADATRSAELDRVAQETCVVLNMAGPFRRYGDPLVDACVRAGTDYLDISGETARIRHLIDRVDAGAVSARVRVVPFCGASSLPADLAVYLLDRKLGGGLREAKAAMRLTGGSFNGGTIASMIEAIESGDAAMEADPFLLGPTGRAPMDLEQDPVGVRCDRELAAWTGPSPLGRSDTRAIRRSATLRGVDLVFQEYLAFDGRAALPRAVATTNALRAMNAALRWLPTRRLLQRYVQPGQGPTEAKMDAASFALTVMGRTAEGGTGQVSITGAGDAGNRVTVACACEAALAIASERDSLSQRYGVITPSIAAGDVLARRLPSAGLQIDVSRPS